MENQINITPTEIYIISNLSILFKEEPSAIGLEPNSLVCWDGDFGCVRLHLGEKKISTISFEESSPLMYFTLLGIIASNSFTHEEF